MRASTRDLIRDVALRHGVTTDEILSRARPHRLLAARIEIAMILDARGYKGPQIAAVLRRDSSMAYFYLGRLTTKRPSQRTLKAKVMPTPMPPPPQPQIHFPVRYAGWDRTEMLR